MHAASLLALLIVSTSAGAGDHLLAGARLFRDERYAEALVEFRVAERLGAGDAAGYAGATLVKLARPEEAVEAFAADAATARDALLEHYRALAWYEARLYLGADRILARIGDRSGPRIAEQVSKLRERIAAELRNEPSRAAIDWYLARCAARRGEGRAVLAEAYCGEAGALSSRRGDRYRLEASTDGAPPPRDLAGARP